MAQRTVTLSVTITAPEHAFNGGPSSEDTTDDLIYLLNYATSVEVA